MPRKAETESIEENRWVPNRSGVSCPGGLAHVSFLRQQDAIFLTSETNLPQPSDRCYCPVVFSTVQRDRSTSPLAANPW